MERVVIITDSDFSWLPLEANLAVVLFREGYLVDILHMRNEKQAVELEFGLPEYVKLHAIADNSRKRGGKIGVAWLMLWFLLRSLLYRGVATCCNRGLELVGLCRRLPMSLRL